MRAAFRIFMPGKTAPMLAALILSGCVTTYDDGYYPARPLPVAGPPYGVTLGHYANFGEYAGPIFGYPGDIFFVREGRTRYRIMGHHDDLLGFAYIEHDYRIRIVDPYGVTLYWYYLQPNGHYHILDVNYGHLGTLSPGHRHFASFSLFSKKHVRHYSRHDIDNDRHTIEREVHDRKNRGRGRGQGRGGDDGHDIAERERDHDGTYERSAPAASRRPAEIRNARRPVAVPVAVPAPAPTPASIPARAPAATVAPAASEEPRERRRNMRRVRDQGTSQLTPPAVQQPRSAPTAISPSRRENVARSRTLQQGRITTDSDTNASSPPSAQRVQPSRARSIAPVVQPRAVLQPNSTPAATPPVAVIKAKEGDAKSKAEAQAEAETKVKTKAQTKTKAKSREKRRERGRRTRKDEIEDE